jgi:hypothetical protein
MQQKVVLPVKGLSAEVGSDFDQAEIKLSWTTKAGNIKPDLDLMIFGITEAGKPLGIFSSLYQIAPKAWDGGKGDTQGRIDDFPFMRLDQDSGVASRNPQPLSTDESDDETVTVTAFAGHKEISVCLFNYSAAKSGGQPSPFKAWGTKLTMTLKKGGSVTKEFTVNVDEATPGIGIRIAKFSVENGLAKISNATKVFADMGTMRAEVAGSETFFDA